MQASEAAVGARPAVRPAVHLAVHTAIPPSAMARALERIVRVPSWVAGRTREGPRLAYACAAARTGRVSSVLEETAKDTHARARDVTSTLSIIMHVLERLSTARSAASAGVAHVIVHESLSLSAVL